MLGVWIITRFLNVKKQKYILGGLAIGAFLHTCTFVWINSIEYKGVSLLNRVVLQERHRQDNYLQLGNELINRGYQAVGINIIQHVEGLRIHRANISLAKIYLKMGYPEKSIEYLKKYDLEKIEDKTKLFEWLFTLIMAYDLAGHPLVASDYYIKLLRENLLPDGPAKEYWMNSLKEAEWRNRYWIQLNRNSNDAALMQFYLRYYFLNFDEGKLREVMLRILQSNYTPEQWNTFISIAKLSNQPVHRLFTERASANHPEHASQFRKLAEESSNTN